MFHSQLQFAIQAFSLSWSADNLYSRGNHNSNRAGGSSEQSIVPAILLGAMRCHGRAPFRGLTGTARDEPLDVFAFRYRRTRFGTRDHGVHLGTEPFSRARCFDVARTRSDLPFERFNSCFKT